MKSLLKLIIVSVADTLYTRVALQMEILALRHQVLVLQRKRPKRLHLIGFDRLLWVCLSRFWPKWRESLVVVKPQTVIKWHRNGFRLFWRWKSRRRRGGGRLTVTQEIRELIQRMNQENLLWGAPRIHGELLKLGFEVAQSSVSKYMVTVKKPPSQTWKAFLENHASSLASLDFFTVPTIFFQVLHVLVILHHECRRIVFFNVTTNPTSTWVAQQIREAFPWDIAPRYLIYDRDPAFQGECQATLKGMGIKSVTTAPASPWQNPYVERLFGSLRRECLDHMIVLDEGHLRRVLKEYVVYYHGARTHLGLGKECPVYRPVQPRGVGEVIAFPHVGGLHHEYLRKTA
ncbi:MAG: transposase [Magnetococcales bacterium]|nr:transposase [Magnetococcales bacterium]